MHVASSKPRTRRARTRRAMRVATIFTGVAACTGGVAQAAHAQGIRPETARPAASHTGSIRIANLCGYYGTDKNWEHVSTTSYNDEGYQYLSMCFGYRGAYESPPYTGVRAECGGNNHGYLVGLNGGYARSFWFGPGTTYYGLYWSHLYTVAISGWAGADACPIAPDLFHGCETDEPGGCAGPNAQPGRITPSADLRA
jgi:hypothetical protein